MKKPKIWWLYILIGLFLISYILLKSKDIQDIGFALLPLLLLLIFILFAAIILTIITKIKGVYVSLMSLIAFSLPWFFVFTLIERTERHNYLYLAIILSLIFGISTAFFGNKFRGNKNKKNSFCILTIISMFAILNISNVLAYVDDYPSKVANGTYQITYSTDAKLEFIIDSPYRIKSNEQIPLFIAFHDVDETDDGYTFYDIEIWDNKPGNEKLVRTLTPANLDLPIYYCSGILGSRNYTHLPNTKQYHYWYKIIYLDSTQFDDSSGIIYIEAKVNGNDLGICPDGTDLDQDDSIKINIDNSDIPKFSEWYCGDTHYHSSYTDTTFLNRPYFGEFGGPLDVTMVMADSLGIDWVIITDHSNSFNLVENDWDDFVDECDNIDKCLIGEEINCNYESEISGGNHLLGYNLNDLVNDLFGGTIPSSTNPSCEEIIDEVKLKNGFSYAAHPASNMDAAWGLIKIINPWEDEDYSLDFNGLEIWNGDINDEEDIEWDGKSVTKGEVRIHDLETGLKNWTTLLLNGKQVFISAGSDAHGDFNEAFGREYTCCYAPYYSKSNIFNSLKNGACYMGNNGALKLEISSFGQTAELGETMTVCNGESATFRMDYNLTNGCTMRLYEGIIGNPDESPPIATYSVSGSGTKYYFTTWGPGDSYYRIQCTNLDNDRIYTNPIWINIETTDSDGDGHTNSCDICPNLAPVWEDDSDDDDDGLPDPQDPNDCDTDSDDDGIIDGNDNCVSNSNSNQANNDGDSLGDVCDDDDDNDGILDVDDQCPNEPGPAYNNGCPDTVPPPITVNSPINHTVYNSPNVTVNLTTNELVMWYINWYSNEGNYSMNDTNWVSFMMEDLDEGDHTLFVRAVDYSNNTANTTINFVVDIPICVDGDGDTYYKYDEYECPEGNDCDDNEASVHPPSDGMTITQNTTFCSGTYNLPNGITIGANNVELNCNHSTLVGIGTNDIYGIKLENRNGVTIKNCDISNYYWGIRLYNSDSNHILKNTVAISGIEMGIVLWDGSDNNRIFNNTVENGQVGFWIYNSNGNQLINNTAKNNWNDGFESNFADNNIFRDNIITNAGRYGFWLSHNANSIIEFNNIYNNTIYNLYNFDSVSRNAEKNWWGTTNESEIASKIYDYHNDNSKGVVDYDPWLCEASPTNKNSPCCVDNDGDSFNQLKEGCGVPDCDDSSSLIHPGATELCNDLDDDCDGEIDEEGVCGLEYSFNLNAGWNMISLPLVPENNTVEEIFGDCISTLDIKPVVRWQSPMFLIAEELYPKEGYWLFSPTSTTCNITGLEIDDNTLSLVAGWNMVGTTSETNDLNISLIPNQVEMRPAVIWQFPLFVETTTIEPGKSAWIFVTQNTEVEI